MGKLEQLQAKWKSQERMIDHLWGLVEDDEITNSWERDFIQSIKARIGAGIPLSERQDEKLTDLYEKY